MALGALREDEELTWDGEEQPTWADGCPRQDKLIPPKAPAHSDVAPIGSALVIRSAEASSLADETTHDLEDDLTDEDLKEDPVVTIEPPPLPKSLRARTSAADDTNQQDAVQAERSIKRHESGPRRRLTLSTDSVRDAVEQRYREEGQWESLIDMYLHRVEVATHSAEKSELLKRIAEVFARELDEPEQAFHALIEAIDLAPEDEEIASALEDVARKLGDWQGIVDAIRAKLVIEDAPMRELRFSELLVRWHRAELHDPAGAEPFLARIRKLDPSHPLAQRRLASVYREVGVWDAQRDALDRALLSAKTNADRRAIHLALGELYEQRAKDPARAWTHYGAVLATPGPVASAERMTALCGQERICRVSHDLTKLARVIDEQIDAAATDDERVGALVRLAEIHERHFVKPQAAAPKLETVLDLDPSHAGAFEALERCYQAMRAWPDLVRTLERRIGVSENPLSKTDLMMRIAEVCESKLGDIDAALTAYRRVYDLDDGHKQALVELARLSERKRDWTRAAAYRSAIANLCDDAKAKAQMHAQIGEMLALEERDPAAARVHYEKAASLDPTLASAWVGLRALANRDGDPMNEVHCVEQRAEHTESPRMKAQLFVELARMKLALGDTRGAFATFDYALRTDPSNEAAAEAVFDDYVSAQRWVEAQNVCEVLINVATREADGDRIFTLLRVAAKIALSLGNPERALLAALAAYDMRPGDAGARDGLIDCCHRMRHDAASRARTREVFARLVVAEAELAPSTLVSVAQIRHAEGDFDGAIETLCRVLALNAEHERALNALAEIFAERGDWKRACSCRQRLALATENDELRHARLLEVAGLWETRAKNLPKAALLLEDALVGRASDAPILHKLVSIYGALELWDKLVDALQALSDIDEDVIRRARNLYAMAGIVREKLGGLRRAARLYDKVLELDENRLDAFEHIVRIYTELREWTELRVAYAKMLGRVHDRPDADLKHALYHQLGLVFRDRLGDAARALEAFRCANQLKPDSDEDRKIVIELFVVMDKADLAVATTRAAILRDPLRPAPFHELCELQLREGAFDKAWCAIDALKNLGQATADETRFFLAYPPCELAGVPGTLASSGWSSHILHPDLDVRLSSILRIIAPVILRMRFGAIPEAHRAAWLGKRLSEGDSESAARIMTLVQNACEILGVATPAIFERPTMPVPFAVAPTESPALFVSIPAAEAIPSDLLPYLVARRIAELRPDLVAHALFPTEPELKGLLKAAMRIAVAGGSPTPGEALKPAELALARAMLPSEIEALRGAVSLVIGNAERVEIRRWLKLADASLSRVGMLLAGDFETAWRAMQCEARAPGDLTPDEWRREMLGFTVSDEYADLRGAIGVSIEANAYPDSTSC